MPSIAGTLFKFGKSGEYNNTYGVSDDSFSMAIICLRKVKQTPLFIFINLFISKQAPFVQNKNRLEFNFAGCLDYKNESVSCHQMKRTGCLSFGKEIKTAHTRYFDSYFYISCILRVVIGNYNIFKYLISGCVCMCD